MLFKRTINGAKDVPIDLPLLLMHSQILAIIL